MIKSEKEKSWQQNSNFYSFHFQKTERKIKKLHILLGIDIKSLNIKEIMKKILL